MAGARLVGIYRTDAYTTDRGTTISARGKVQLPADFPLASYTQIITDAGFTPIRLGTTDINPDVNVPCGEGRNHKARRLVFYRANGNSFSIKIANRADLVATATLLRNTINAIDPAVPIVCIKYVGERFKNIYDELGGAGAVTPTPTPPRSNGRQFVYAGTMNYLSDAPRAATAAMRVKVNTDVDGAPPTFLGAQWTGCVGAFLDVASCSGRNPRDHRRYIVTAQGTIGVDTVSFETEVPVRSDTDADILACGQGLAALESVYCVEYRGEKHDRLHTLLPAP